MEKTQGQVKYPNLNKKINNKLTQFVGLERQNLIRLEIDVRKIQ